MSQNVDDFFEEEEGNASQGNPINIKKILFRVLRFWYIILFCILMGTAIGVYKYKTTEPIYKISSLMLINEDDGSVSLGTNKSGLPGINIGTYSNINNLIVFLTSKSHIKEVLKKLDFTVGYYQKSMFQENEIYKRSPFVVMPDSSLTRIKAAKFDISFTSKSEFTISETGGEDKETHHFFDRITKNGLTFTIVPRENSKAHYIGNDYSFTLNPEDELIKSYRSRVRIALYRSNSSVYEISIAENNKSKGADFINVLSESAVQYNLDRKNYIANNTINFIDKQLSGVSDSLSAAEKILEDFRSTNEVMDVSMQGQMIISQSQELEKEKAALMAQLDYYNYLDNYIENNHNVSELMAPSSMGVQDPILKQLISELSVKHAEKASLQFNSREDNPNITRINRQIETIKSSILENTKSIVSTINIRIDDLNKRLMGLSREIKKLPKTEQLLLGIERKFKFNDEMYKYLLQRRSEAQLAKASNLPDNEIIEYASTKVKLSPDKNKVFMSVVIFGLFLPAVIIFILLAMNNRILDKEELENVTKSDIIGTIPVGKATDGTIPFISTPQSIFSESLRGIRTNLEFYSKKENCRVILVTSSIAGEGKTFFSVNLAACYAQLSKKTLMIGLDLRRPMLSNVISNISKKENKNEEGLSSILSGKSQNPLSSFITTTELPNLEYISAGKIPPNPAELIAGSKTAEIIEELKQQYDVIIIDTPPVGLVSDAQLLAKFADNCLMVSRQNYTPRNVLNQLIAEGKLKSFKHLSFVFNGVPTKKSGYTYKYGGKYYAKI